MVERVLLAAGTWERIEGKGVRLGQYVLGVDLGGAAAMTLLLDSGLRPGCYLRGRLSLVRLT